METAIFEKKLKPLKPVIGIALIVFGLFLLSTLFQTVIYIKAVIGGPMAIAAGIYLLLKPFDLACARCKKFLSEASTHVSEADSEQMIAALKAKDTSQILSILKSGEIPKPADSGDTRQVLEFEHCEDCKSVARMRFISITYDSEPSNNKETERLGWIEISDPSIADIYKEGNRRNEHQNVERYKHLMPQTPA